MINPQKEALERIGKALEKLAMKVDNQVPGAWGSASKLVKSHLDQPAHTNDETPLSQRKDWGQLLAQCDA